MSFIATKEVSDTAHGRVTPPTAHGALSDIDGNMVIAGEKSAIAAPDTMARKEH